MSAGSSRRHPLIAVLADFGEAVQNNTWVIPYFNGFSVGGAQLYLGPEILNNARLGAVLDYEKSDVYGMGVTAYQMLAGIDGAPYNIPEHEEREVYIPEDYVPLSTLENSPAVCALVKHMVELDRAKRASAEDVVREVAELCEECD